MSLDRFGIAIVAIGMAVIAGTGAAQAAEIEITCANLASGTTWQIKIDYDRQTVDSNPASISDDEIAWHDKADGGNYTLDRKSGKLTVIFASSTAGHFLYHHCRLEN